MKTFTGLISLSLVAAVGGSLLLLPATTHAWTPADPAGSCTKRGFAPVPRIKLRWASNYSAFTATQKAIIREAVAQFNQLPDARLYIYEAASTDTCISEQWQLGGAQQPANTICVGRTTSCDGGGFCGQSSSGPVDSACVHNFCEIEFSAADAILNDPTNLFPLVTHEFTHCFGVAHSQAADGTEINPNDTMGWTIANSDSGDHTGLTRDAHNALSFLNPFGTSFYVGNFGQGADDDIITRDASQSGNVLPWYLTSQNTGNDAWTDRGEVISDFGSEETLPYLVGDFTGDGCDDLAAGLCTACDPDDGVGDTIGWYVKPSNCSTSTFGATTVWASDWGDGEDYDQYRVGDFDGDGCDDLWLLRNQSSNTCNASLTDPNDPNACVVEIFWALARKSDNGTCAGGGPATKFVGHGQTYRMAVSDRSAASTWPWVVGDFFTTDGLGCDDIAVGIPSRADARVLAWHVLKAADSNGNTLCDQLQVTNGGSPWIADLGALGQRQVFAAEAGNGAADDLIIVTTPVTNSGYYAYWTITYSNGSNGFSSTHTPIQSGWYVSGTENHWSAKVFGVGNFDTSYGTNVDLLTLRAQQASGAVTYDVAYRINGAGSWSYAFYDHGGQLPTAKAAWNQPTDNDSAATRDNAGDDVKDYWRCPDCEKWYCALCLGCCS